MKSPTELSIRLAKQWQQTELRTNRILASEESFPFSLPITRPTARAIQNETAAVKNHLDAWRAVQIGTIQWETKSYRAVAEQLEVPTKWIFETCEQWVKATRDPAAQAEFASLQNLLAATDLIFHPLLVRRRLLWRERPLNEVTQATQLALALSPGCAEGKPLRALSFSGIDTKFFERHERLIIALLDVLYDGEVSHLGLEDFLGAYHERDHWLLILDLDGSLLPFPRFRLASHDLAQKKLPGTHLLIVENETCQHQLPTLPNTIAVLGTGFDLNWMSAPWLTEKKIAYWGDLDTWGLELVAKARQHAPNLTPILMDDATFRKHQQHAVPEPSHPGNDANSHLTREEAELYHELQQTPRGRLEQEFLPTNEVQRTLQEWLMPPGM